MKDPDGMRVNFIPILLVWDCGVAATLDSQKTEEHPMLNIPASTNVSNLLQK